MDNIIKNNRIHRIIIILSSVLVIFNAVMWGTKKEGFHEDEIFTYGLINSIDRNTSNVSMFYLPNDCYLNKWHDGSYYKNYFVLTDGEFNPKGVCDSTIDDVHPPLYYIFFHIYSYIFFRNVFSKWAGLSFNIIFLLLTTFILYLFTYKITENKVASIIITLFYSLGAGAMRTTMMIRMYQQLTFATLLYTYLSYLYFFDNNDKRKRYILLVLILMTSIFGFLTQYFFIIYAFFLTAFYCVLNLIKSKNFKNDFLDSLFYGISMLLSVLVSYVFYPTMYDHIFSGYRGQQAFNGVVNKNVKEYDFIGKLNMLNEDIFGKIFIVLILAILLLAIVFIIVNKRHMICFNKKSKILLGIFLSCTIVIIIIAKITTISTSRYFYYIYPVILMIIGIVIYDIVKIYKNKIAFIVISVLGIFIFINSYFSNTDDYLYKRNKGQIEKILKYKDYDAITLACNPNNESLYLQYFNRAFPADVTKLYKTIIKVKTDDILIAITSAARESHGRILNQLKFENKKITDVYYVTDYADQTIYASKLVE